MTNAFAVAVAVAVAVVAFVCAHQFFRPTVLGASDAELLYEQGLAAWQSNDTISGAHLFQDAVALQRRLRLDVATPPDHPLLKTEGCSNGMCVNTFRHINRPKLRHDAEQLELLIERGILPAEPYTELAEIYAQLIEELPDANSPQRFDIVHMPDGFGPPLLHRAYNRAIHLWWPPRLDDAALAPRTAVEWATIQQRFYDGGESLERLGGACPAHHGVVVVDDLLSDATLEALLRWCEESTMWFASRAGYLGAFYDEAFNAPLLLQVAEELRGALGPILAGLELRMAWAFKYSNHADDWPSDGVRVHADEAAINVNLWLTPNSALLHEGDAGGLTIFTKQAPTTWEGEQYNYPHMEREIEAYLEQPPVSERISVGYRQNRATIFNSNLFHASQATTFKPGYTNRRINLTLLFGKRASACPD